MENKIKKLWKYWWVAILLIVAPFMIMSKIPDSDTFFLMETGKYIVENGTVPTINPFVIHEGFQVVIQQWLFDVIIYKAYAFAGNMGLFLFVAVTYAISMALLYKYFSLFTKNHLAKGIMMVVVGILYIAYGVARPTSVSFIMMVGLLYCLERYRQTGMTGYLFPLPALSLVQINMHAAMWPMMFVLMMPYVFPLELLRKGDLREKTKNWYQTVKPVIPIMLTMFAIGFINPNGINGMTYVLNSYGSATNGLVIAELRPPNTDTLQGLIILASVAGLACYIYKNKQKFRDTTSDTRGVLTKIAMMAGVLILACMHERNMWYLFLGATPVLLELMRNIKLKLKRPKWLTPFRKAEITVISLVLTAALSCFMFSIATYSTKTTKDSALAPYAAADYLDQAEETEIRLYTEFNNGAYMEWRGYKVYMDARPELFQKNINGKENIYDEFGRVTNGTIDYQEFLDKYDFSHLIVSNNTRLDMYLSFSDSYTVVVNGKGYKLYEYKQG